jgi:hypothetical protein
MIRIDGNRLRIEIEHPSPEEFLKDLRKSIIVVIQNQSPDDHDLKEMHFSNYTLLELLKALDLNDIPLNVPPKKLRKPTTSHSGPLIIPHILPDLP